MPDLPPFGYRRVESVDEAVSALSEPGARVLAGGTDVIVALSDRRADWTSLRTLVDIKPTAELRGIGRSDNGLCIGTLATADELANSELVQRWAPALAEAASASSSPALRRRATLGGNLCSPHPAGDMATALLALNASVDIASTRGVRSTSVEALLRSPGAPLLEGELLLRLHIRPAEESAFEKIGARRAFSRSIVAAAVAIVGGETRGAFGGIGERPCLAVPPPGEANDAKCGRLGLLRDDATASAAFRAHLAQTLLRRCERRCTGATG